MKMTWKIKLVNEQKLVRDYLLHDRAFSNQLLKDIKRNGHVSVNGQPVTVRHQLEKGQTLSVELPKEQISQTIAPAGMELNQVYEDDYILILNKPRGIAVLPNMNDSLTLANGIAHYYQQQDINSTIHIVTRLDKWTSGLVLIAKHRYVHQLLSKQYIHREYRAIVEGRLESRNGVIDQPISRNLPSIIERKVDPIGKRAMTHYQVLKEMSNRSLMKVQLETGRTHQIRVHFSHIGHPLVGDDLYGARQLEIKGQALHARELKFHHPIKDEPITCVASYPNDILNLINFPTQT